MNVLISGGSKNGKSAFAQQVAATLSPDGNRCYVATMIPYDGEDRARVARHVADRAGMGFRTLEIPRDIAACLTAGGRDATFLIDSVTALLLNEMYPVSHGGEADGDAAARCRAGLTRVAAEAKNAVFVTDYIYSDAMRYDAFTENYRADLASIDRALAAVCGVVLELCAGNVIVHKGVWPL